MSDRHEIKILIDKKYSYRSIAKALNKSVSTISDEIKRNSRANKPYDSEIAHHKAYVRRHDASYRGKMIVDDKKLKQFVDTNLLDGQTPEAIAGRILNQEKNLLSTSKDTIYRYKKSPYGKVLGLEKNTKKKRSGRKAKKKLEDRKFIEKRPKIIELRQRVGDMEGDFIVAGRNGSGILLVVVCRKLRIAFLEIIYEVSIENVHKAFLKIKDRFQEIKSLTLDNDILFRQHKKLEILLGIEIYFCNPYHSWEKGTVENTNKYIRKYIPKGSDLSKYDEEEISAIEKTLNQRYMKCLDYKTPEEVLKTHRKKQKNNK